MTFDLEIPDEGILSKVLYKDDKVRLVGFAFESSLLDVKPSSLLAPQDHGDDFHQVPGHKVAGPLQ